MLLHKTAIVLYKYILSIDEWKLFISLLANIISELWGSWRVFPLLKLFFDSRYFSANIYKFITLNRYSTRPVFDYSYESIGTP